MNFFAHSLPYLDDPWFVAGVCLPDWLSVVNRRVRLRRKKASLRIADRETDLAAVARGVVQHHVDDEWFHEAQEFSVLNLELSVELRSHLKDADSLRTWFVSHILIEMLLDAFLDESNPGMLAKYYSLLESIDRDRLQAIVEDLSGVQSLPLATFLPKFIHAKFLFDYQDDALLLFRINQVMTRVGLTQLPDETTNWIGSARIRIYERASMLLSGWQSRMVQGGDDGFLLLATTIEGEGAA